MRAWFGTLRRLAAAPFQPPTGTRRSRLSRQALHEVTIYLGDDNTIFVQHLCMSGKGQAEVAIRMCWEAMQHLAMQAGLGLTLPAQAAIPVQVQVPPAPPVPVPEGVPVQADNGSP